MAGRKRVSVSAAYIGVIVIWSTTPLAIKWSSEGGGFLFGVTGRMLLGAVLCYALIRAFRIELPWRGLAYLRRGGARYLRVDDQRLLGCAVYSFVLDLRAVRVDALGDGRARGVVA